MIVLIPLGGKGERFKQYASKPKALIDVENKPIIFWLLDNLQVDENIEYIYIPYNIVYKKHDFETLLTNKYPHIKFRFFVLEHDTDGAAETVAIALKEILHEIDKPILCIDADNFYTTDIIQKWNGNNLVFSIKDYSSLNEKPKFSYVACDCDNVIQDIKEKERISDIACTGAYGFSSFYQLYAYTKDVIDRNIKDKGEYYISTVIKHMINNGLSLCNHTLNNKDYFSFGTPEQVHNFGYVFLFDLDGTLIDTDSLYIYIWGEILKKYNLQIDSIFFDKNIKGKSDSIFLKSLISNISDDDIKKISEQKDQMFISNIDKVKIYDGVYDFIAKLQNNRIAIVTNCNTTAAATILKHFKLDVFANTLICSEDCRHAKPNAEPYLLAIQDLHAELAKCIVFEDSLIGYMSAKNAKIDNIIIKLDKNNKTNTMTNLKDKKFYDYCELNIDTILSHNTNSDIVRKSYKIPIYDIEDSCVPVKNGPVYICNIYSYKLCLKDNEQKNVILKICNKNNPLSETAHNLDLYNNEYTFYDKIACKLDEVIKVPKCYGLYDEQQNFAVLLENLNLYKGCFNLDLNTNLNVLLKVVNDISRMHLKFHHETEHDNNFTFVKKMNEFHYYKTLISERFETFIEKNKHFIPNKMHSYMNTISKRFDSILDALSTYPLTLCHGDLKSPNIFYSDYTTPYFLDWQYVNLSKGVTDIIFLLCESADFDKIICDIVLKYYYMLIKHDNPLYDYETYMHEVRLSLCAFPFVVSVWFNSENADILDNKTFPIRFLKNTMQYMEYILDDGFIESL